jgi:xylulokinase
LIKWFRDNFAELEKKEEEQGGDNAYHELDKLAEKIAPGSDGLVVLPYFMGERNPIWDTDAKGTIVGLSLAHTKAHIYRAFLEAVAYSLRHSMECTGEDLGESILLAGGVTKSKVWRQIFADVTGYPVVCPMNDVEANLGDVILAGIGTGLLTYDDVRKWRTLGERTTPNMEAHEKYNEYYKLYHSLYGDLKDDMKKLSEIR